MTTLGINDMISKRMGYHKYTGEPETDYVSVEIL